MVRLFIRDKSSGIVREYGTNSHDSLIVNSAGSIDYYNLQCGDGSPNGFDFVTENGTSPDDFLGAVDIGGESCNINKLTAENAELRKLLRLAYNDIKMLFEAADYEYQKHESLEVPKFCRFCKYYTEDGCEDNCVCEVWRYIDELKKYGIEE